MSPEPYQYIDSDGDRMHIHEAGTSIYVEVMDCARSVTAAVSMPAEERQAAARVLAGGEFHVVRADPVDDKFIAVEREEYERLKSTANMPTWERELLAGQAAQQEIDQLRAEVAALRERDKQPDRPEPVDPASVRVWDVVEVEGDDWMVRGPVVDVDDPNADGPRYSPDRPVGIRFGPHMAWPNVSDATVRVLHRAEPEPDPAAVEALAKKLYAAKAERIGLERDWSEIGNADQLRHHTEALTLIRDHGVRVEVQTNE